MQHEKIDQEISELMKEATAAAKSKNYTRAVKLVEAALSKIQKSNLLYSHASYTKIIPYYQKAGLYSEVESYCLNYLVPSIRAAFKKGMSQRCKEIQAVHFYQNIAKIYDKLRLAAKREKEIDDEARFLKEYEFYENKWKELKPVAEKLELEKEYKEILDVFGSKISEWPLSIRSRFESLIKNT